MGLYGFKPQFVPYILEGSKTHTIRANRAHPDVPGNTVHLYTGLRGKGPATLLFRAPCVRVEPIEIMDLGSNGYPRHLAIRIGGDVLTEDETNMLAWRDGFRPRGCETEGSWEKMHVFWKGRLPFIGQIIHWDYERRTLAKEKA